MPQNPFADGLSVQLDADASGLESGISGAISKLGDMKTAVAGAGVALGALAGGAMAKSVTAAADFQEAMVEVEKVTSPEIAREMGDAIKGMAAEMPIAQEELAAITEQAGRLGVEGTENLKEYTRVAAQMATATDLTAEEAADSFARIGTLMDIPISKSKNLGSAMNELANTMGTSSSEITDVMTRAGSAFNQLGVGAEEALSLSAAMNEVSPSSRLAAGGMKRMAEAMMDPGNVESFADVLGVTHEEFKRMREEDPSETLLAVADAAVNSKDAADELKLELGKAGSEFITLGQNTDSAREGMESANQAWKDGTGIQKEAEASASTFNSQMKMMRNRLQNIAITIGEQLLPPLTKMLGHLVTAIDTFSAVNDRTNGMAAAFTLAAGAVTGVVSAAVLLAPAIASLIAPFTAAIGAAAGLGGALTGLAGTAGGLATLLYGSFNAALAAAGSALLALPGAALSAATALGTTLLSAVASVASTFVALPGLIASTAVSFGSTLVAGVMGAVSSLLAFPGAAAAAIASKLSAATASGVLSSAYTGMRAAALAAAGGTRVLTASLLTLAAPIAAITIAVVALYAAWKTNFLGIRDVTEGVVSFMRALISGDFAAIRGMIEGVAQRAGAAWDRYISPMADVILHVIDRIRNEVIAPFLAWFTPIWNEHFSAVAEEVSKTADVWIASISRFIEWARPYISAFLDALTAWWGEHGDETMAIVKPLLNGLKKLFEVSFSVIADVLTAFFRLARGDFSGFKDAVVSIIDTLVSAVVDLFRWLYQRLIGGSVIPEMLSSILSAVRSFDLAGAFRDAVTGALRVVTGMASDFAAAGRDLASNIARSFKRAFNSAIPSSVGIDPVTIAGKTFGGGSISIPQLESGGFIEAGGLAQLHAGETVVPADVSPGGGGTHEYDVDVTIQGDADRRDVKRGVSDALRSIHAKR